MWRSKLPSFYWLWIKSPSLPSTPSHPFGKKTSGTPNHCLACIKIPCLLGRGWGHGCGKKEKNRVQLFWESSHVLCDFVVANFTPFWKATCEVLRVHSFFKWSESRGAWAARDSGHCSYSHMRLCRCPHLRRTSCRWRQGWNHDRMHVRGPWWLSLAW